MEKLYTVEDIAKMTGLTGRTIRNYLADGKLKGRKIGSQWRFTESDIAALFSDPEAPAASASRTAGDPIAQYLAPQQRSGVSICSVIDCPVPSAESTTAMCQLITDTISTFGDPEAVTFDYTYLEAVNVARFTLIGPIDLVSKLVKLIRKKG